MPFRCRRCLFLSKMLWSGLALPFKQRDRSLLVRAAAKDPRWRKQAATAGESRYKRRDLCVTRKIYARYKPRPIPGVRDWQPLSASQLDMPMAGVQPIGLVRDSYLPFAPNELEGLIPAAHQYSEASIIVSTRCVMPSLAGFSDPLVQVGSK